MRHLTAPISMDIFESGNGQIHVPSRTDVADDGVVTTFYEPGTVNPWIAEPSDNFPGVSARTREDLITKVADMLGISGRASIYDSERDRAKGSVAFDYVPKPARAQARPSGSVAPVGPPPVPVGATDADRARARPRLEGETDTMYAVRTAPSEFAAEQILRGYDTGALRAVAREAGITVPSGATKLRLMELLLAPRRRWRDSQAISRG